MAELSFPSSRLPWIECAMSFVLGCMRWGIPAMRGDPETGIGIGRGSCPHTALLHIRAFWSQQLLRGLRSWITTELEAYRSASWSRYRSAYECALRHLCSMTAKRQRTTEG